MESLIGNMMRTQLWLKLGSTEDLFQETLGKKCQMETVIIQEMIGMILYPQSVRMLQKKLLKILKDLITIAFTTNAGGQNNLRRQEKGITLLG